MSLGRELGRGVRSVVYAWGDRDVVKVLTPATPSSWLVEELRLLDAAARAGAPVPGRRSLVDANGRLGLVSERIVGPSMWELLREDPSRAGELGVVLARIQAQLAACPPSYQLPRQRDRLAAKIHRAAARYGDDLLVAIDLIHDDGPLVLCHGDLHPGNVILGARGPVLVDWFDTSRGAYAGEIARTVLMLDESHVTGGGDVAQIEHAVAELRDRYLLAACGLAGISLSSLSTWHLVQAIARLAEGFGADHVGELREALRASVGPLRSPSGRREP